MQAILFNGNKPLTVNGLRDVLKSLRDDMKVQLRTLDETHFIGFAAVELADDEADGHVLVLESDQQEG